METFKELKRVAVISRCIRGDLACAKAAELLVLTPRHVQRLKARFRQGGAAAPAHASRSRPSPRRIPERTRQASCVRHACYAGFNDHHLREKLVEWEGFSLSRETLRRLLRSAGIGSPRKRPPAHRQRRLPAAQPGEFVQLDGSPHAWLEGCGPRLTALGMQDDASGKILAAQFFLSETAEGYFHLLQSLLRRFGVPLAFYGDRSGIFVRNASNASGACCRTAFAVNFAWPVLPISIPPTAPARFPRRRSSSFRSHAARCGSRLASRS
jgi:transposase